MEIREIDYILAICDNGSMLKAAEQLFITQPALSKYIQNMEVRLGYQLFDRQKKNRLTLTPAGEIYVRHARIIANERDALVREMADSLRTDDNVCIGMGLNISERHFDEILRDFKIRYPNCNISIRTQRLRQNLLDLQKGILDFSECSMVGNEGQYEFLPVYDDYILLALPDGHPLLSQVTRYPGTDLSWIDIHLFDNQPFVFQDETCWVRTIIDAFLAKNNFSPTVFASTNSTATTLKLVEKGVGLAFCTTGLSTGYKDIHFVHVGDPPYSYNSGLIFRKGEQIRPQAKYLASLFVKYNAAPQHVLNSRIDDV